MQIDGDVHVVYIYISCITFLKCMPFHDEMVFNTDEVVLPLLLGGG